ncbi:MAG: spore coat protein [Spirochaetales bacterium]|nr:MAG: spore coat protein [Spirochaetales bacterium]
MKKGAFEFRGPGGRTFRAGEDGPVFIIAEIGTGHGGSLDRGKELIDAAARAGADCAKFQVVYADEIIHPLTGEVPLPGGSIPLFDRFRQLEQGPDFYAALKIYTESRGLVFLASPFGLTSARLLKDSGVSVIKIASPELNHFPLLDEVNTYGLPVILSTGVSLQKDIEKALSRLSCPAALLHCITAYPAPEEEYNLAVLESLARTFGVPVGVSDHSLDPELVPGVSMLFGCSFIEKHICLSREDRGLDDPVALPQEDFAGLVKLVRRLTPLPQEERRRFLEERFGAERVRILSGDGIKRLAPAEAANYERTRRSVHALCDLAAGTVITMKNTALLRTEKKLKVGLPPELHPSILGKRLLRPVASGEGITREDVSG